MPPLTGVPRGPGADALEGVVLDAEALPVLRGSESAAIPPLDDVIRDEAVGGCHRLLATAAIGVDPFASVSSTAKDVRSPFTMLRRQELRVRLFRKGASGSRVEGRETVAEHLQRHGMISTFPLFSPSTRRLDVDAGWIEALERWTAAVVQRAPLEGRAAPDPLWTSTERLR